jgi:hypothetical protein
VSDEKAVDDLFEVWDEMITVFQESSTTARSITKGAWEAASADPPTYTSANYVADSVKAYANGVNTWRRLAGLWSDYAEEGDDNP